MPCHLSTMLVIIDNARRCPSHASHPINSTQLCLPHLPTPINILLTHDTIINRAQQLLPTHQHPPQPSTPFPRASPLLGDVFLAHQRPLWPSTLFPCAPPRLGDIFPAHECPLQPSNFIPCISLFIRAWLTLSLVRTPIIINTVSTTPPPSPSTTCHTFSPIATVMCGAGAT